MIIPKNSNLNLSMESNDDDAQSNFSINQTGITHEYLADLMNVKAADEQDIDFYF